MQIVFPHEEGTQHKQRRWSSASTLDFREEAKGVEEPQKELIDALAEADKMLRIMEGHILDLEEALKLAAKKREEENRYWAEQLSMRATESETAIDSSSSTDSSEEPAETHVPFQRNERELYWKNGRQLRSSVTSTSTSLAQFLYNTIQQFDSKGLAVPISPHQKNLTTHPKEPSLFDRVGKKLLANINVMMLDEAEQREYLEKLKRYIPPGHLSEAFAFSRRREERLKEMAHMVADIDELSQATLEHPRLSPAKESKELQVDPIALAEFSKFMYSYVTPIGGDASIIAHATHFTYLKDTLREIESCLFEGAKAWRGPFVKRRILDVIARQDVEIQPNTPAPQHGHAATVRRTKCTRCGRIKHCEFDLRFKGFRLGYVGLGLAFSTTRGLSSVSGYDGIDNSDRDTVEKKITWMPLDRVCRDRIVAVADYFMFLSHLRRGLFGKVYELDMEEIFSTCLRLRRRIAMARIGGSFDDEGL
ncbi:uncharacterized protein VTP21DRAFT_11245 [Calcarisporiella thermophila]|uniref:uncharacterized protein n=1 Tax=Calcarisporiella thermophila TaxID=911321 RepID=UPI0037432D54